MNEPRRRVTVSGIAVTCVLMLWAALYIFLLIGDRTSLYLSARTAWLVPVGGILLVLAAIGRVISIRSSETGFSARDVAGMVVLAIPVVVVLALPPASLGSFAAARRSQLAAAAFVPSVEDISTGNLSLADVAGAVRSDEAMAALRARAGAEVSFIGFVNRRSGMPTDEFLLTRFLISCCVADALSVEVRVVGSPPGAFSKDQWVRVTGLLYPLENEVVIDATRVERVAEPAHPYLNA